MLNSVQKKQLIDLTWQIHGQVEQGYLDDKSTKQDQGWQEKRRLLLADMAIHLLQTALKPDALDQQKLQDNLYAVLTVADDLLEGVDVKAVAQKLLDSSN